MRITFLLPPVNMSGGIRVIAIYAQALAHRGHEIFLISPPPKPIPLRRRLKTFIRGKGWPRVRRALSHIDGLGLQHHVLSSHRPIGNEDVPDADVVIATWWETAEWIQALSPSKGSKVYFIQGYEVFPYLPIDRVEQTYRSQLKKIVVARWLQEVMRTHYGDHDVVVVPNAVDHQQFHAPLRGRQVQPTVGFLYSEMPLKGIDVTLQVLDALRKMYPELRTIGFGSSPPSGSLKLDSTIELSISPPQDEIRNIYAQCDVWLSTSRSEGFNLIAIEAMACRTPVVSTRTGWPAEAVIDGYNGMLAEIDDVTGLISGVEKILSGSPEEWCLMSENAFQTVSLSSWDRSIVLFEQALIQAFQGTNGG